MLPTSKKIEVTRLMLLSNKNMKRVIIASVLKVKSSIDPIAILFESAKINSTIADVQSGVKLVELILMLRLFMKTKKMRIKIMAGSPMYENPSYDPSG